jgi:hypothetical protein
MYMYMYSVRRKGYEHLTSIPEARDPYILHSIKKD